MFQINTWIQKMSKRKYKLKRYPENDEDSIRFSEYTIIVPTKRDRKELLEASRYLHDLRCIDTGYIAVNQLVHEYEHKRKTLYSNIIINKELYDHLNLKSEGLN